MTRRRTDRIGLTARLLSQPRAQGRRAAIIVVLAGVVLVGLALLDHVTGPDLSLSFFYLVPCVVVAIAVSTAWALVAVVAATVAWLVADAFLHVPGRSAGVQIWNGASRLVIFAFVVVLVARLRDALLASRASERHTKDFLADAAHQLRTPVAGVRATAEALVLAGASPSQEALLFDLTREAARIGGLVRALLRMARLDEGEALVRRPGALADLLEEEVDRARRRAPALDIGLAIDASVPPVLLLDVDGTTEACANVLENACRHARHRIAVRATARDGRVRIEVDDDGPGLPPGDEQRVFDRFVSLDGCGGTGLGLAVARGVARRQRGDLVYERPSFVLTLPLLVPQRAVV